MRIGILTASKTNNNGTDLQAFAMQRLIDSLGYDAEIIDYDCAKLNSAKHILDVRSIKGLINLPWAIFMQITHERFRKKYLNRSNYMRPNDLDLSDYDAIVVGSDQIWNLNITGNDLNFFLPQKLGSFRRLSYAASIGKGNISEWDEKYHISSMLSHFCMISVREKSGIDSLNKIGITAREDLDPIIMLGKEGLMDLMPNYQGYSRYALLYLVEENHHAINDAIEYSNKHNCKLFMINGISKPIPGVKIKSFVGLQKWLFLMNNAEIVFTNSYHGVSTSITLNTEFRAYPLESADGNLRVLSLLDKTGMRQFYNQNDFIQYASSPNWETINEHVEYLRNISRESLRISLNEG